MRRHVAALWERRRRRGVRRMMRGFRHLRDTPDGLELVTIVKDRLSRTPFTRAGAVYSPFQFGAAHAHAETAVRQFLMLHLAGVSLNKAILRALGTPGGKLRHPLPPRWRAAVEAAGVPVAHGRSRVFWWLFVAAAHLYGCRQIAVTIFRALRGAGTESLAGSAFFVGLAPDALPAPGVDGRSFDVITWYSRWPGRRPDVLSYSHSLAGRQAPDLAGAPVRGVAGPVPLPPGAAAFAAWGVRAAIGAAAGLIRGRWWHAVLLPQSALAARARLQPGRLAADYLFHNSDWLYRPLWTYEAQQQGSRILFYFYSTNAETFKYPHGYPLQANTWNATNWPHYLVWDEHQVAFLERHITAPATIDVVGPIWFHSSPKAMPSVSDRAVAVFDVQPVRESAYRILGAARVYYTPGSVGAFLSDVEAALAAAARPMVFKRKRTTVGHFVHGTYRKQVAAMAARGGCATVDPEIAAWRVVEACAAVISMPFTSTALIGRAQGKPSIYYVPDHAPFFPIQRDDRAAHGIPVVAGREELTRWLQGLEKLERSAS